MNDVKHLLLINGFKQVESICFKNEHCEVWLYEDHYALGYNDGWTYSKDLNVYWLIGILTYYSLMDKNYKQEF